MGAKVKGILWTSIQESPDPPGGSKDVQGCEGGSFLWSSIHVGLEETSLLVPMDFIPRTSGHYGQEGSSSLVSVDPPSLYVCPCIDGEGKYH